MGKIIKNNKNKKKYHYGKNLQKFDENFQKHINFLVISCLSTMGKTIKNKKKTPKIKKCHYGENRQKCDENFQKHRNFSVISCLSTIGKTIKNQQKKQKIKKCHYSLPQQTARIVADFIET